jgi:hypothetical protein
VGSIAVGVKQLGAPLSGPCDAQHTWPVPQQLEPQHEPPQLPASIEHGAGLQVPSQNGVLPPQVTPHAPQCPGSFAGFTH